MPYAVAEDETAAVREVGPMPAGEGILVPEADDARTLGIFRPVGADIIGERLGGQLHTGVFEPDIPGDAGHALGSGILEAVAADVQRITLFEVDVPEGGHAFILIEVGTVAVHHRVRLLEADMTDKPLCAGRDDLIELPAVRIEDLHPVLVLLGRGLRIGSESRSGKDHGCEDPVGAHPPIMWVCLSRFRHCLHA